MGMFDNPTPFRDTFTEGEVFLLQDVKLGPTIKTDFGDTPPVLLKIDNRWYSLFGQGLTSQVQRMEAGDLPARVSVQRAKTRSDRPVKLLVPEGQDVRDFADKQEP